MDHKVSPYDEWEGQIVERVGELLETTRSDADGIVMAQSWGLGLSAAGAADRIVAASRSVKSVESPLDILRGYPSASKVSDLYDTDQAFGDALGSVFGDSFEYPDFSHRTVGDVIKSALANMVKASHSDAELIAREKGTYSTLTSKSEQVLAGKVLGVTEFHVVLSLGRSAAIVMKSDLSRVPEKGEDVTITFNGDKGLVADPKAQPAIDCGR